MVEIFHIQNESVDAAFLCQDTYFSPLRLDWTNSGAMENTYGNIFPNFPVKFQREFFSRALLKTFIHIDGYKLAWLCVCSD